MKAKKTNDLCFCSPSSPQGGCSACRLLMGLGSPLPAQPSPALLESTVWSDPVCQLSALLSHGSVLTGVSEAGAAPARKEELGEGPEALPSPCPTSAGGAVSLLGRNDEEAKGFYCCSRTCPRPVASGKSLGFLEEGSGAPSKLCKSNGD